MRYNIIALITLASSILFAGTAAAEQAVEGIEQVMQSVEPTAEVAKQEPQPSAEELWKSGEQAYSEGRYADAVTAYKAILDMGLFSEELYYNAGNAYFKNNELGEAILYYRRALSLDPADEDIIHNLEFARRRTKDRIEQIPEFVFTRWTKGIRDVISSDAWAVISLVCLCVAGIMLLIFRLAQSVASRRMSFYVLVASVLLFIASALFAWSSREATLEQNEAVVMSSAVSVKSSPDKNATELFVLHEGTELIIGESTNGWVEVRIADGRKGWIEESRIEKI